MTASVVVTALGALGGLASPARAADMAGAFSIVLRDPRTGELGLVAISHAPACGAWVPWLDANVGAVAVQGDIEPSWGPRALAMLARGVRSDQVVDSLRNSDPGWFRRQIGVLDRHGWPGGFTGPYLVNWSGGWLDSNLAVQGNTMPGSAALQAVVDTLYHSKGHEIVARLFGGLAVARAVRADFRGPRSAVLLVGRPNPDRPEDATRYVSLRVDDARDPVAALAQAYGNWRAARLVAARLDDASHARGRGETAAERAATAEALAMARVSVADTTLAASSLNAMAWALAQHDTGLELAWAAVDRARQAQPRSNEFADTAAEIRLRQGRFKEAHDIELEALTRIPLDDYLRERTEDLRKRAGLPPDSIQVAAETQHAKSAEMRKRAAESPPPQATPQQDAPPQKAPASPGRKGK